MVTIKSLPLVSTGVGLKVMGTDGEIYTRVLGKKKMSSKGNFIVTLQDKLMGNVIETVTTIKNGHLGIEPVILPNKVFKDAETGIYYILAREDNKKEIRRMASKASCGYLYPEKQADGKYKPVAYYKGKVVTTPKVLTNECGISYYVVEDLVSYGEVCKRSTGWVDAQKIACVYLLPSKVGEEIETVVNGVKEHSTVIEEGDVKVQNPGGEAYKMEKAKFLKNYEYDHTTDEGFELWKPKPGVKSWVRSEVNIICILWGGFEVLVTPMICISDPQDTYGCNYAVFYGNDILEPTYQVRKVFLPVAPITRQLEISSALQDGHIRSLESIPKLDYVEAPNLVFLSALFKSA